MLSSNLQDANFASANWDISNTSEFVISQGANYFDFNYGAMTADICVQQWSQQQQQAWQPVDHNIMPHDNYNYHDHRRSVLSQSWKQRITSNNFHPYLNASVTTTSPVTSPNQFQRSQIPRMYNSSSQYQRTSGTQIGRSHQAHITMVPNSIGGYKAVVKRKRKRTIFTTEQVEYLETVFAEKSYVTSDDRQIIVEKLKVSDSAVKVWFQNRRIKRKRDYEEALHRQSIDSSLSEESLYSPPKKMTLKSTQIELHKKIEELSNVGDWNDEEFAEMFKPGNASTPNSSSRLGELEAKLIQRVDEFGYITVDKNILSELINIIDIILPKDIDTDVIFAKEKTEVDAPSAVEIISKDEMSTEQNCNEIKEEMTPSSERSDEEEKPIDIVDLESVDAVDIKKPTEKYEEVPSMTSSYAGSIYEPISPTVVLDGVDTELEALRWKPSTPEKSLQRLFDLHFC